MVSRIRCFGTPAQCAVWACLFVYFAFFEDPVCSQTGTSNRVPKEGPPTGSPNRFLKQGPQTGSSNRVPKHVRIAGIQGNPWESRIPCYPLSKIARILEFLILEQEITGIQNSQGRVTDPLVGKPSVTATRVAVTDGLPTKGSVTRPWEF